MVRFEINGNKNVIKILSIVSFAVGLLLISFPSFIGLSMIRIVGVLLAIFSGLGIYFTEGTIWGKDRSFFIVGILIGVLVLLFPSLVMIISGIGILSFVAYKLFFIFKDRDFSDKTELAVTAVSLIIGIIFIFNGKAAVGSIVRIVGVLVISFSAILFYKTLDQHK